MSDDPCKACGHDTPHDQGEYEDTHVRCGAVCSIERIAGYECGHKRYSAKCEREYIGIGGCYSSEDNCACSSEDRTIAALRDRLREIGEVATQALAQLKVTTDAALALDKIEDLATKETEKA